MMQGWRRTCQQHLEDLSTPEQFDEALPAVIDRARNHYLDNSRPLRDSMFGGYSGRPPLSPPPADDAPGSSA
jgi:hypothetical protein